MRASFEFVQPHDGSSLRCRRTTGERFNAPWHFHPEIEIMFVEHSRGTRFVGDSVAPFREGDLVLLGPNLPHVWINRDVPSVPPHDHAIGTVVQFRADILGGALWTAPEFAPVADLLRRSAQGVQFLEPDASHAAAHISRMWKTTGIPRLAELLLTLDLLASSSRFRVLATAGYAPKLNHLDARRINAARRYVQKHLTDGVSQPSAAALARLTPATFSRFFRQKMGCTFSAYVTQLRLARAIHLMVDEEMTISEACFASGFNNLSNFNRHFRSIKGMNPRAYLDRLHQPHVANSRRS